MFPLSTETATADVVRIQQVLTISIETAMAAGFRICFPKTIKLKTADVRQGVGRDFKPETLGLNFFANFQNGFIKTLVK